MSSAVAIVMCDVSVLLLQKLSDVAPSSSEGSTVDLRHLGKEGDDALDFELEESTDPEACFTAGDSANSLFTILRLLYNVFFVLQLSEMFCSISGIYHYIYSAPNYGFDT